MHGPRVRGSTVNHAWSVLDPYWINQGKPKQAQNGEAPTLLICAPGKAPPRAERGQGFFLPLKAANC